MGVFKIGRISQRSISFHIAILPEKCFTRIFFNVKIDLLQIANQKNPLGFGWSKREQNVNSCKSLPEWSKNRTRKRTGGRLTTVWNWMDPCK